MPEPITTGLTIAGLLHLSKDTLNKLLGPTADYLGDELSTWTKKRHENTSKIFSNATRILGDKINEPGEIPPKVLKGVLTEGSFCDDELTAEYFGGVLASSRSNIPRDDRGAYFISLIGRLSVYQLRLHYIFYTILKDIYSGNSANIYDKNLYDKFRTHIPKSTYEKAMDFSAKEKPGLLVPHIVNGLIKEDLINTNHLYGELKEIKKVYDNVEEGGLILEPTSFGVEFYLWVHGMPDLYATSFLDEKTVLNPIENIEILPGAQKAK